MSNPELNRRDVLKSAARWAILPIATLGLGWMATRKGDRCEADFLCGSCRLAPRCRLPQAIAYRRARPGGKNG